MLDGTHYFECDCGAPEHTLRFMLNKNDSELYTEIYLYQHRSWLKRVLVGIKYIFGYQSRYGAWDCWILKREDARKLADLVEKIL